jgi:catechol 2,3-dioxygenase-like lactoylglutathione lyase family enzyme
MSERSPLKPHVSPKVRAYGKARIDIAKRVVTRQDWDTLWKQPQYAFPFKWGKYWKQCIEYRVDDFASEIGFFIDVLGFPVLAFDPSYAMFSSPAGEFTFAVVQTTEDNLSTPADAIRIQFMVEDIAVTVEELERRGVRFVQQPAPLSEGSSMYLAAFQTPHGILMEVWGEGKPEVEESLEIPTAEEFAEESITETEPALLEEELEEVSLEVQQEEDLFEEVRGEPKLKGSLVKAVKPEVEKITQGFPEDEFKEEVRYVDEPDAAYPKYQPIPLRK